MGMLDRGTKPALETKAGKGKTLRAK